MDNAVTEDLLFSSFKLTEKKFDWEYLGCKERLHYLVNSVTQELVVSFFQLTGKKNSQEWLKNGGRFRIYAL